MQLLAVLHILTSPAGNVLYVLQLPIPCLSPPHLLLKILYKIVPVAETYATSLTMKTLIKMMNVINVGNDNAISI